MAIQIACPACSQKFNAPDAAAGKKVKCPKCGGVIAIAAAPAAPVSSPAPGKSAAPKPPAPKSTTPRPPAARSVPPRPAPPPPNMGLPPLLSGDDLFANEARQSPGSSFFDENFEDGPALQVENRTKTCPMCGETIQAVAVKCKHCGEILDKAIVRATSGARRGSGNWQKTRTGAALVYYCTVIGLLIAVMLGITGGIVGYNQAANRPAAPNQPPFPNRAPGPNRVPGRGPVRPQLPPPAPTPTPELPAGVAMLALIGGLIMLGCQIGEFVGVAMCATAPSNSGARFYAMGAAACTGLFLFCALLGGAGGGETSPVIFVGGLFRMIGAVLYILFIRRCGVYLGDGELASSATGLLIFVPLLFVGYIVAVAVAIASGQPLLLLLFVLVVGVCGLIAGFWYLKLLGNLMTTVEGRARR